MNILQLNSGNYPETPEEAKSEGQLLTLVDAFRLDNEDFHEEFFTKMVENYGFWDGTRQWWEKVNGNLTDLKQLLIDSGKPALTKNIVFPLINLTCGIESQEPLEAKMLPRSKGDAPVSDAANECIKFVFDKGKFARKTSRAFFNALVCGRGWIAIEQIPDDMSMFETKTLISSIDPGEIMYDRKSQEYDLSDCDQLQRTKVISRSQARLIWPDKAYELNLYFAELDSRMDTNRLSLNKISIMRRAIAVMETWYRTYEMKTLLLDSRTGDIIDVSDIPQEQIQSITSRMPTVNIFRKRIQTMKLIRSAGAAGGVILDAQQSPYDDFYYPYIPMWAYRSRDWDFGMVEQVKDPQREVNKRSSQLLQILNEMPKTRMVTDDPDAADKFEQGEDIIVVARGSNFKTVDPPPLSTGHARLEEISKDDVKRISGVNDNLQGLPGGANEPGIVVSLRQRQGMAMIGLLFDNREDCVGLCGQIVMSRIRQFMSPEQVARIIGAEKAQQMVLGPDGQPMNVIEAMLTKSAEDYDMVLNKTASAPSIRMENAAKLKELLTLIPALGMIATDVVIDAFDVPQKEELVARLEAMREQQGQPPGAPNQGLPPITNVPPTGALPPANSGVPVTAQGG